MLKKMFMEQLQECRVNRCLCLGGPGEVYLESIWGNANSLEVTSNSAGTRGRINAMGNGNGFI